jgi:hypothetical protein
VLKQKELRMPRSISRFILNDNGNVIDTTNQLALSPACPSESIRSNS